MSEPTLLTRGPAAGEPASEQPSELPSDLTGEPHGDRAGAPTGDQPGGRLVPLVGVVGTGRLAAAVAERLSAGAVPDPAADGYGALAAVVVAADGLDQRDHDAVRQRCAAADIPWLPVRTEFGTAVIGPVERPAVPGCAACAEIRTAAAQPDPSIRSALRSRHGERLATQPSPWLAAPAVGVVAELAAARARAAAAGAPVDGVLTVDLATLHTRVHRFLPYPHCAVCGQLPADTAEAATLRRRLVPKEAPDRYRVRDLDELAGPLLATYVDDRVGLVREVTGSSISIFPLARAPFGYPETAHLETGWGRTGSYRVSRLSAVLEALERIGGARPGGRATAVRGTYRELAGRAVDPTSFGLFPPGRYDRPGFPFRRYHEDLVLDWVWGYSFGRREPVLVPEGYAYYRTHMYRPDEPMFVYEISNGCALGGCLEEAVLHGLLEIAERDAFLLTWYARLPVPEVDLDSARDRTLPLLAERIERRTGTRVHVFDITVEQNIPCFWVMAVDEDDRPDHPKVLCAAGSAIDPERGIATALHELAPMLDSAKEAYAAARAHIDDMVADPHEVREMADHSLLYNAPAAFDRLSFLFGRPPRHLDELRDRWTWPRSHDLSDDVAEMVGRYTSTGLDVIVVDQTTAEHRALDLSCVKVIVPGTLPMTFGHDNRRTDGLPRIRQVPHLLGYTGRPLAEADVNPYPHPFP